MYTLVHVFLFFHVFIFPAKCWHNLNELTIQMPGYAPETDDEYVAISVPAVPGYIVKFSPSTSAERVHHLIVLGCDISGPDNLTFWKGYESCPGRKSLYFAWARNAPDFHLPTTVAFSMGHSNDNVKFIIMQLHYAKVFDGNIKDYSGITLYYTHQKPKFLASVMIFNAQSPIPPKLDRFLNNASCTYKEAIELHPFAFRTHTHAMGRVASAFLNHAGEWTMIGKRNPQWPQTFQKIDKKIIIRKDDWIGAVCRFDSMDQNITVYIGHIDADEMCQFHMMYYYEADHQLPFKMCNDNELNELMQKYPTEGVSLLPPNIEWEHEAHRSGKPFSIKEKIMIQSVDDHNAKSTSSISEKITSTFQSIPDQSIFYKEITSVLNSNPNIYFIAKYKSTNEIDVFVQSRRSSKILYSFHPKNQLFYEPKLIKMDKNQLYLEDNLQNGEKFAWKFEIPEEPLSRK